MRKKVQPRNGGGLEGFYLVLPKASEEYWQWQFWEAGQFWKNVKRGDQWEETARTISDDVKGPDEVPKFSDNSH